MNKVDPLGITNLRIRGMWHIKNPNNVFNYLINQTLNSDLKIYCIMKIDKYNSFPVEDRKYIENTDSLKLKDVKIKNPDNPALLIDCKFLEYCS